MDDVIRGKGRRSHMDPIYSHPVTGAKLFVGNQTAAKSESMLVAENIFHVVNCLDSDASEIFRGRVAYKHFPISRGPAQGEDVIEYFERGCHQFIEKALDAGRNVLVHCLAGAHRAGTAGVSFVMRQRKIDVRTAIILTKFQRPIVDPFGDLIDLLYRLQEAYLKRGDNIMHCIDDGDDDSDMRDSIGDDGDRDSDVITPNVDCYTRRPRHRFVARG